jgi:diguanylate cyclase (GGDEF)-like protein
VRSVIEHLPRGRSLPEDVWRVRHRALTVLLLAHVPVLLAFGALADVPMPHVALETFAVAAMGGLALSLQRQRELAAVATAVGLVTCSAVLVHLSGGTIELHFHFFVVVSALTLYQDWLPYLLAVGYVSIHHGVIGVLAPEAVYNHPAAIANPVRWALVHGAFVLAASLASVAAWRLNEEQALKDALTGLPNRRLFGDRLDQALSRAQRHDTTVAVLNVDLDGFKAVNDTYGHAAGDELLARVAERLRALTRSADTAARLGGDEFALLIEDILGEAEASYVAERILSALATPFPIRGHQITIGASVGIAISETGIGADEIMIRADRAMYRAKQDGGNRATTYGSADGPVAERPDGERDASSPAAVESVAADEH